MKKIILATIFIAVIAFAFVAGGAAFALSDAEIVLTEGGETVFIKSYDIKFSVALKVLILYGGKYSKYYEEEYYGNPNACLGTLNGDIADDIQAYADSVYREEKDARVEFSDGEFTYFDETVGCRIDVDDAFEKVIYNLSKRTAAEIVRLPIEPTVRVEELKRNTVKVSEYSTSFSTSGESRRHNVILAAEKLNNTVVPAGEKLSFNGAVGERTAENGFLEANVIKDGEFVSGVGGGVCQVSTTLFNCWLKAGLNFENAAAHSLPVSYVSPSLDAMVSSETDLVLSNTTDYPIYIRAYTAKDRVYFVLYGSPRRYDVVLRSVTVEKLRGEYEMIAENESESVEWAEGETERIVKIAKDGLVSESYRDYYENGRLVKTEKLRKNTYKMQKGKKIVRSPSE